jgi:hypothetical protein
MSAKLYKAVISVMKKVKGIDKNSTVGTGSNSFKAVSDQDVKQIIGKEMEDAGLCIFPISIEPVLKIDRWTENTQYGEKQKQNVFTEVKTKYLLAHESGESIEIVGYGHGVDSQDKSAGKATTYALKYALLYTFMVATGKIDDSDNTHSDDIQHRPAATKPVKPEFPVGIGGKIQQPTPEELQAAIDNLNLCETKKDLQDLKKTTPAYIVSDASFIEAGKKRYEVIMAEAAKLPTTKITP